MSSPQRGHTSRETKRSSSRATRNGIRQIDGGYIYSVETLRVATRKRLQPSGGHTRAMIDASKLRVCPAKRNKVNQSGRRMGRSNVIGCRRFRFGSTTTRCPIFLALRRVFKEGYQHADCNWRKSDIGWRDTVNRGTWPVDGGGFS